MESALSKSIRHYKNYLVISINPKIYPLEVVHSAAYVMIDRAYVILDGNPEDEILVELRPKNKKDMKSIASDFMNELLNYAVYYNQTRLNKDVRNTILQRAFATNSQDYEECESTPINKTEEENHQKIEDPLGIAKPWTPPKKKR